MMARTHVMIGVSYGVSLLSAVEAGNYTMTQFVFIGVGLVLGSLMPDIDHPHSTITQHIPLIGPFISRLTQHRSLFHSILGVVMIYALLVLVGIPTVAVAGSSVLPLFAQFSAGFMIGYILHIGADMLTMGKVRLFYPLQYKVGLGVMVTGGGMEYVLRAVLGVYCLVQSVLFLQGTIF